MQKRILAVVLAAAAFAVAGCGDDTAGPGHNENLAFVITPSEAHAHTLDVITFTVAVTDDEGNAVTDFQQISLEYAPHDTENWRTITLTVAGGVYQGTQTFTTSGEYEVRVMGRRHTEDVLEEMHRMAEHLEVGRAHVGAGGYRVEYESFPGHIHEGDTSLVTFWVMEETADPVTGVRAPIGGLAPTGECAHESGTNHPLSSWTESATGTYEANHLFDEGGATELALFFTGSDGMPAEGRFQIHVSDVH